MVNSSLRMAKVIEFHQKHSATIVFTDTGARVPRVQIMAGAASSNTGTIDLAAPTPALDESGFQPTNDRDIYCLVGFLGNVPVILGFLYPQVSQMFFRDLLRSVSRHASDVYTTVDGEGNLEVYHPSGTYLRIGTTPDHEDLTGADIDGKWKIEKNVDTAVHVRLRVANAGSEVALVEITPEGDGNLHLIGGLTAAVDGDLSATVGGNMTASVSGSMVTSAASWEHTGPVTFKSDVLVDATLTATTDVVGSGKSLKGHKHTGVSTGGGVSGPPQ